MPSHMHIHIHKHLHVVIHSVLAGKMHLKWLWTPINLVSSETHLLYIHCCIVLGESVITPVVSVATLCSYVCSYLKSPLQ